MKQIELTDNERLLLSTIERLEESIKVKELSRITHINERNVLDIISSLRKKGIPVVTKRTGKTGVKLAKSQEEINKCCLTLMRQSAEMTRTTAYLKASDLKHWRERIKTI